MNEFQASPFERSSGFSEQSVTSTQPPDAVLLDRTPGICGGETRLAGHRITVRNVLDVWRSAGERTSGVLDHWPYLSSAQIEAALTYAADHPAEIEEATRRHQSALARLSN